MMQAVEAVTVAEQCTFQTAAFFSYHFIKKRGMILEITKIDHDHCRDNTTKSFLVLGKISLFFHVFRELLVI